jgi:hypothetical protein
MLVQNTVISGMFASRVILPSLPRFSGLNLVNVTLCPHYPSASALEELTVTEECLIAKPSILLG